MPPPALSHVLLAMVLPRTVHDIRPAPSLPAQLPATVQFSITPTYTPPPFQALLFFMMQFL